MSQFHLTQIPPFFLRQACSGWMVRMGGSTMLRVVYLALLSLPVKGTVKGVLKIKTNRNVYMIKNSKHRTKQNTYFFFAHLST
jgi:hypothetical protein